MPVNENHQWLKWAADLQAIAQNGLAYTPDKFDHERYEQLLELTAEILAKYSKMHRQAILNELVLGTGYATPKLDVRGVVIVDNKILLVKERSDNLWSLPGGWADINTTPSEA